MPRKGGLERIEQINQKVREAVKEKQRIRSRFAKEARKEDENTMYALGYAVKGFVLKYPEDAKALYTAIPPFIREKGRDKELLEKLFSSILTSPET